MIKTLRRAMLGLLFCAGAIIGAENPASAGDNNGDFMVRMGVSVVNPDSSADVFFNNVPVAGGNAEVSTQVIPSATLTYFFTKNIAAELFCCFSKHDVEGKGSLNGVDLGNTWIFPPIVTLQYHFDSMSGFKPYVGAGMQYIAFFNEKGGAVPGLKIDNAFGFALQAGVDVEMGRGWYLNADVKKVWLDTDATWTSGHSADVTLDPWIFSVGVGYRFNLFGPRTAEVEPYK